MIAEKAADMIRGRKMVPFEPAQRHATGRNLHQPSNSYLQQPYHINNNHRRTAQNRHQLRQGADHNIVRPQLHSSSSHRIRSNMIESSSQELPSPLEQSLQFSPESFAILAQNITNTSLNPPQKATYFESELNPRNPSDEFLLKNYDSSIIAESLIRRFSKLR